MSNSLTVADVLSAALAAGVTPVEQSKFIKLPLDKKAIYIAKSKSGRVTRIDISGFSVAHHAVNVPKKKNGLVTGQVDMRHDDAIDAIDLAITGLVNGDLGMKWFDNQYVTAAAVEKAAAGNKS